jgi:biotin carboxylase
MSAHRPQRRAGRADVVIVESLGTGHGLRLVQTACRLGLRTVFVTVGLDRYRYDVDRDVVTHPPTNLTVLTGVDTRSPTAIAEALSASAVKEMSVLAQVDRSLPATADACAALGLRFVPVDVVRRCTDKMEFRAACRGVEAGRVLAHRADTVQEAVRHAYEIGYPVIVKPATGTASLGVRSAMTADQVARAAAAILAGSEGQPSAVLLEEYLAGPLVSAECFRHQGTTLLFGMTDRVLSVPPSFAELAWSFPLDLPEATTDQVARTCTQVLDAVGFDTGPAHVELVLTTDGPRVVEINPRMAGRGLGRVAAAVAAQPGRAVRQRRHRRDDAQQQV